MIQLLLLLLLLLFLVLLLLLLFSLLSLLSLPGQPSETVNVSKVWPCSTFRYNLISLLGMSFDVLLDGVVFLMYLLVSAVSLFHASINNFPSCVNLDSLHIWPAKDVLIKRE